MKWLFRTIMATETVSAAQPPAARPGRSADAANVAQRLRADQLFDNLLDVLGCAASRQSPRRRWTPVAAAIGGPRRQFTAFGYDPSERRDEIAGSIPQALALMNSPTVNAGISRPAAARCSAGCSTEIKDDEAWSLELYLRRPRPRAKPERANHLPRLRQARRQPHRSVRRHAVVARQLDRVSAPDVTVGQMSSRIQRTQARAGQVVP